MDYGIDVSNWNAISDAHRVRAAGISFAWCKASEGERFTDPTFAFKISQLRAVGIVVNGYHFLDGSDPAAQGRRFRQIIGDAGCLTVGSLMPMADMESASVRSSANAALAAFYDAVGVGPQDAYGNLDWWANVLRRDQWGARNFLGHIARYNGDPGNPGYATDKLAVHQHTDAGNVDGIPGHVDRNATMPGYSLAQICIGGVAPIVPPPPYVPPAAPPGDIWTVHAGDTLSRIASVWGVTVSALASVNGIPNANLISVGELIHKPGSSGAAPAPVDSGQIYVVRSGDTLSGIAISHGTSVPVLVSLNHIANPDRISIGQAIVMPERASATPPAPRVYLVRSGDTLGAIAARLGYPGGYVALGAHNNIHGPQYVIYPNQQIFY
jgi:LysM repeat protein